MTPQELIDQGFIVKEQEIAGDTCVLVYPDGFEVRWSKDNLIYRSSIWRKEDFFPISLSYKKFFNYGEQIELIPDPTTVKNSSLIEKIDGSTLCVSRYKEQLIIRTRQTFDFYIHGSATDMDILKEKYPRLFTSDLLNDHSIITEYVSPNNIIVLPYPTPDLILTNIIRHSDYSYMSQDKLDEIAVEIGVPRPEKYSFNDVADMIAQIQAWKGKEGCCIYYQNDQQIKKLKSLDYLARHAFKNDLSLKNMLEYFFTCGKPSDFQKFYEQIEKDFDFECANMATGFASKIITAKKEADKIVKHMMGFVEPLKKVSRKEAAQTIMSSYGKTIRAGIAFNLLDGKTLSDKDLKKIMGQLLE